MTESSDKTPRPADQEPAKKLYSKPRLEVYGDLRKITEAVRFRGRHDGFFFFRTAR